MLMLLLAPKYGSMCFAREKLDFEWLRLKRKETVKSTHNVHVQVLLSLLPKDHSPCAVGEPESRSLLSLWSALCHIGKLNLMSSNGTYS